MKRALRRIKRRKIKRLQPFVGNRTEEGWAKPWQEPWKEPTGRLRKLKGACSGAARRERLAQIEWQELTSNDD